MPALAAAAALMAAGRDHAARHNAGGGSGASLEEVAAAEIHFGHSYLPLKSDPFNSEQSAPSLKGITDCEKLVRREPKQLLRPKRCRYSEAFLKYRG